MGEGVIYTLWHDGLQLWFVYNYKMDEMEREKDCGNVKYLFRNMRKDKLNILPLEPIYATHASVPAWWKHATRETEDSHDTNINQAIQQGGPENVGS